MHVFPTHIFASAVLLFCQTTLFAQKENPISEPPGWLDGAGPMIAAVSKDRTRVTVYSSTTSAFTTVGLKEPLPDEVLVTSQAPFVVFRTSDSVYVLNDKSNRFAILHLSEPTAHRVYMNEQVVTIKDDGIIYVFGRHATSWSGVNTQTGVVIAVDQNGQKAETIVANQ